MDYIYVAVFILVLFNAKKRAKCDNEDIIYKAGCNISLTWILPITKKDLLEFNIGSSHERSVATVSANSNCDVRDDSSMLCSINRSDNGLIVVLNMFNVTAGQSGNYKFWKRARLLPEQYLNTSKTLVVIGKPNIIEVRKPIFGLPFEMTCKATYEQEHYLYRWRINGVERTAVCNVNSHNISNLDMNDTFSNVTCQVCVNDSASNLSSVTCLNDGCSIDSDPYTIHVLYGPDNVSLSREERHFYLKEHHIFAIDCFANCYPNCIFWWKGRVTIESQTLNITFESRMSGQYTCHVTNQQTNITLISDPITLHDAKEDKKPPDDNMRALLGMGFVGVVVLQLVVIGMLLVRQWRKIPSVTIDSGKLSQVCVQQTGTEVSHTELERHNRHLHIPSTKSRECKRTVKLECPNKSPEDNIRPNLLDDHYSTIDDDALSDDDLGMNLFIHKHSHETRRDIKHIHYDYAYSIGICHVETDLTHVADETSLTPSNDFARPVEIYQDEGNEVPDTNHAYLTVIDDSSHSMEVSQVEETEVNDVDKTRLSPLNG